MKVEIIKKEETEKEIEYPCLMQYKDENDPYIVFFIGYSDGFVIFGGKHYIDGEYSDNWKMSDFVPYKGKVVLEND